MDIRVISIKFICYVKIINFLFKEYKRKFKINNLSFYNRFC